MKSKNKGITLIALVITIIVLLILAGISIASLTGDNGILTKAQTAKEKTEIATEDEQREMAILEAATNTENTKFQGITIPAGFAPTRMPGEDTVDEGLVITDSEGNEFVWIPVEEWVEEEVKLNNDVVWEKKEYEEMKKSVEKYGGFYIGRYEAGSITERKGWQTNGNGTTKMVVKRNQYPYVFVGWGKYNAETEEYSDDMFGLKEGSEENNGKGAVYLCRHMYDGKSVGVKSTLCYNAQWDAMLKFIEKHNFNVETSSTSWGNYYGLTFEINRKSVKKQLVIENKIGKNEYAKWEQAYGAFGTDNTGFLLTTGATDRNKANNLYDVAGNCEEWVMDVTSENTNESERIRIARGASVGCTESIRCKANYKGAQYQIRWSPWLSFRPALYLTLNEKE